MKKKDNKQVLNSLSLIKQINKFQKHLQIKENIKFGRKAKKIGYLEATRRPKALARFILEGEQK
jgi:ABC-type enterochelin transport system ATPase subunit